MSQDQILIYQNIKIMVNDKLLMVNEWEVINHLPLTTYNYEK